MVKKDNELYLQLFANCIPVKGAMRSTICDLQRGRFDFIPNSLYDLLKECQAKSLIEIKRIYGEENEAVIDEYFDFLVEKEYAFFCSQEELECFPDIDLIFEYPGLIENAIIDVNEKSDHDFDSLFSQLESLGCMSIQFRFFKEVASTYLDELLLKLHKSRIEYIELILPFQVDYSPEKIKKLIRKHIRVASIIIHSTPDNFQNGNLNYLKSNVYWTPQEITSSQHCGFISPHYFSVNLRTFSEGQKHNTCLHRKISIDSFGEIKNCPAMPNSFGHHKKIKLREVLEIDEFKASWEITKDQISICRDCEFRHICIDCRALLENPSNVYSKPLKCNYNPYSVKWEN